MAGEPEKTPEEKELDIAKKREAEGTNLTVPNLKALLGEMNMPTSWRGSLKQDLKDLLDAKRANPEMEPEDFQDWLAARVERVADAPSIRLTMNMSSEDARTPRSQGSRSGSPVAAPRAASGEDSDGSSPGSRQGSRSPSQGSRSPSPPPSPSQGSPLESPLPSPSQGSPLGSPVAGPNMESGEDSD